MADEGLQPALLDRLIDDEPGKKMEPLDRRVIKKDRLRQAILRDLAWLFNAVRLDVGVDLSAVPEVRRSVINFGAPPFAGQAAKALEGANLERAIRQCIVDFEPRIVPSTLRVRALLDPDKDSHQHVLGVEIQGQFWAQPVPLALLIRTDIDVETGKVEIADLMSSRVS